LPSFKLTFKVQKKERSLGGLEKKKVDQGIRSKGGEGKVVSVRILCPLTEPKRGNLSFLEGSNKKLRNAGEGEERPLGLSLKRSHCLGGKERAQQKKGGRGGGGKALSIKAGKGVSSLTLTCRRRTKKGMGTISPRHFPPS